MFYQANINKIKRTYILQNSLNSYFKQFITLLVFSAVTFSSSIFAVDTDITPDTLRPLNDARVGELPPAVPVPGPDSPATPTPDSDISTADINEAIGIFSAKCIFPHKASADAEEMGGTKEECKIEDSVVGTLIRYLQNLIPYLAVLVMVWAGYLYYGSATSGSNKQAITAIRGAVGGLVLLLIVNVISKFFVDTADKKTVNGEGASGMDILFGNEKADGSLLNFLLNNIILPLFQMLQYAAGAFAVFSLVYAGYLYILSNMNGDSSLTKKAMIAIKNAVIGFFLVVLAVTIIAFIQNYMGQISPIEVNK